MKNPLSCSCLAHVRGAAAGLASVTLALLLVAPPGTAQSRLWTQQLGTSAEDAFSSAAPDGTGGVYVGGSTAGSLGGQHWGITDAVLARYDDSGSLLWIRQIGTTSGDGGQAVAPDGAGGVYFGGDTSGSLGGVNAGGKDLWLARYDSGGGWLWIRQFGTTLPDYCYAAAPDGAGGVYLCGTTYGSLGGSNAGATDAWLARYDHLGNQLWVRQRGTSGSDNAWAAAPDGSGGVYIVGGTEGNLGGTHAGGTDAWLARYDSTGKTLWIRQIGTSLLDFGLAASSDGSGGVYFCGDTDGSLGGPSQGNADVWLARYDSFGTQLWIRQFGSSGNDYMDAAALDGSGGVHISGDTDGSLGGPNAGWMDVWLARYDGSGNQLWTSQLGTSSLDNVHGAAPNNTGGVYIAGETLGSLGGPNAGLRDGWLARYETCTPPTTYCTAKVNSQGCTPFISYVGMPSVSQVTQFRIRASQVISNTMGLLIYSKAGADAKPFQGGLLCIASPIRRTTGQSAGGNPPPADCSGNFNFDFNGYIATGLDKYLVAGQPVWTQYWYRDTGSPSGTGLTDALHFTICP